MCRSLCCVELVSSQLLAFVKQEVAECVNFNRIFALTMIEFYRKLCHLCMNHKVESHVKLKPEHKLYVGSYVVR